MVDQATYNQLLEEYRQGKRRICTVKIVIKLSDGDKFTLPEKVIGFVPLENVRLNEELVALAKKEAINKLGVKRIGKNNIVIHSLIYTATTNGHEI